MIDDEQRRTAAQIERSRPHWMVMWGCYSRLYWAFPRFPVPKGTIISVSDPDSLVAEIDDIEAESHWRPQRVMVASAATPPPEWWG